MFFVGGRNSKIVSTEKNLRGVGGSHLSLKVEI